MIVNAQPIDIVSLFENDYFSIVPVNSYGAKKTVAVCVDQRDPDPVATAALMLDGVMNSAKGPYAAIPNYSMIVTDCKSYINYHATFNVHLKKATAGVNMASLIQATVSGFHEWLKELGFSFDEYPFGKANLAQATRSAQLSGLLRSLAGQFNFNTRSTLWTNHNNKVFKMHLRYDLVVHGFRADYIDVMAGGGRGGSFEPTVAGKNTIKGVLEYVGTEIVFFLENDARSDLSHIANSLDVHDAIVEKFATLWPIDRSRMNWIFFNGDDELVSQSILEAYTKHKEVLKP